MKRLQIVLTDETWTTVELFTQQANENFNVGSINYSDAINEMILAAKVDVKALQAKHTDVRRSLKVLAAQEDMDLDSVIKSLMELKAKTGKRGAKNSLVTAEAV